jgi:microcystin-dependent protein
MAEPFLGEIRLFSFNYAPRGWALCNGATLQIYQNQALYSLLLNTFGGDGRTTFCLPDLRGRVPVPPGINPAYPQFIVANADKLGAETVTLTATQMPVHTHQALANGANADVAVPVTPSKSYIWAEMDDTGSVLQNAYAASSNAVMDPTAVSYSGGGQAHNNMQPYLAVNYCIAIAGYYPVRP